MISEEDLTMFFCLLHSLNDALDTCDVFSISFCSPMTCTHTHTLIVHVLAEVTSADDDDVMLYHSTAVVCACVQFVGVDRRLSAEVTVLN